MAAKAMYAVTRVAVPPLTLSYVGLEDYGLWAACFVIVSYLGMSASGVALVYLRQTAKLHTQGDTVAINRLLSTGILTMLAVSTLLLLAIWAVLPSLLELFRVGPQQHAAAGVLWLGACAIFLADLSLGAFANVLHALGLVRKEQQVWILSFLLETACIVAFLALGMGVLGLLAAFGVRYVFSCSVNAFLVHRAIPSLELRPKYYTPSLLRVFFGSGAVMQVSGMLATALHSADKMIAGVTIGPAGTAVFDLATKLPATAAAAPSGANGVAVAAVARAQAAGDSEGVREVYGQAILMGQLALGAMLPFMAALSVPITVLWLGASPTQATIAGVMTLLSLSLCWHMLTGPATSVFRGLGHLWAEYVYHGSRLSLYGLAACIWISTSSEQQPMQLAGLLAAAQAGAAFAYLLWSWKRITGAWTGCLRVQLLPMGLLQALALALFALSTQLGFGQASRWSAALEVAAAGVVWTALYVPVVWCVLLPTQVRQRWANALRRRLGSTQAPASGDAA